MNHKKQKHIFLSLFSVGLLAALLTVSCEKKAIQFGEQFEDNGYTKVIETDTITPLLSNIYIDSFVTSGTGSALIGYTDDPEFGLLQSSGFFQLGIPAYSSSSTQYQETTYDSLTIYAKLNKGIWYGDTTQPIKLNVFRVTDNIELPNNTQKAFYNTSDFAAEETPLGYYYLNFRPNGIDSITDTLSIRLSDNLGRELFQKLQDGNDDIQTTEQFIQYFKGIKIAADPTSNLSLSLSDSIQMRLYYTKASTPIPSDTFATFPISSSSMQFSNVSLTRKGVLASQNFGANHYSISSTLTDSAGFLNPMANSMLKITFPTLNKVLDINFIKITNASLLIYPIPGTFDSPFELPQTLNLATTNLNNAIGSALVSSDGSTAQTGNLVIAGTSSSEPYYTFDLTSILTQYLNDPTVTATGQGLLLIPPSSSMYTSFNRLIIGDGKNSKAKMKLTIDYISIK